MRVRLLGTGSADGWPNAFCACASCAAERAAGRTRAQSGALVDDTVLIDGGATAGLAATRAGASLEGVRLLLLTHQHTDHAHPAGLLYRSWAGGGPLVVAGPPDAVDACRPWLGPDADVTFRPVAPGDSLAEAGYAARALPAAHATGLGDEGVPDAVLWDVTGPDGSRLLWATDTGPLPDETLAAAAGAAYGLVLLEETFGDRADHGTQHLDLTTFPRELARLRAAGAVTATSDVVAVHLSHHNPPAPELARRLADWGARVVDDGTELRVGAGPAAAAHVAGPEAAAPAARPAAPAHAGRRTLVLGGARSGKSREAERLLAHRDDVVYVATSPPVADSGDDEWAARVAAHRARRPATWRTVETLDLAGLLGEDGPPLLVDCLTLWLTRVMDAHDAWAPGAWEAAAGARVEREVATLLEAWRRTPRRVVAVSNEVGQGVVPADAGTRRWRDEMGRLNARLAAETEDVRLVVAGRVLA